MEVKINMALFIMLLVMYVLIVLVLLEQVYFETKLVELIELVNYLVLSHY